MISTIIILTGLFSALGILFLKRNSMSTVTTNSGGYQSKKFNGKVLFTPLLVFLITFVGGLVQPYSVEKVDAGFTGIKVNLVGNDRGLSEYTYKTGWVVYNTWTERIYEFPTYQQHIEYGDQTIITKGGFGCTIKPTFNYSLVPTAVGDMFMNLRLPVKEIEQGWLKTAIVGSVNDVANHWPVDSVFNNRSGFENAIKNECNLRLSKWFTISQLRTNILPPPALVAAINDKTKAIQDVQVAENQKAVAVANAQRKIAVAQGDSAEKIINANAEALAMDIKQQKLTAAYLEYLKIQKWDGVNSATVVGNGSGSVLVNVK